MMLEAGSSLRNRIESYAPVNVNPRTPRPGHSGTLDKRSLLKLQNAPHPKVRFFLLLKLTTPLTSPAPVEWKTQANVNGLNLHQ